MHRTAATFFLAQLICLSLTAQSAGQLDSTFADSGYVITNGSVDLEHARSLLLTPTGRSIVVGTAVGLGNDIGVARFLPNGELDDQFGNSGSLAVHADWTEFGEGSALQADGSILIAGMTHTQGLPQTATGLLVRLDSTGNLDAGFGTGGLHRVSFPDEVTWLYDVAVQADDRIVACGSSDSVLLVHRVLANGTADPSFGDGGSVRITHGPGPVFGQALATEAAEGSLVVVGSGIARILPNGELDSLGFGEDGWAVLPADINWTHRFHDVLVQPDGRIVVTGWTSPPPDTLILLRLLPDGTPDSTFAQDGSLKLPLQDNGHGTALALQSDGMIIVTGSVDDNAAQTTQVLLARFDPWGTPDPTFGQNGIVLFTPNVPGLHLEIGSGVAIGPDAAITVAAGYWGAPNHGFLVARFHGHDQWTGMAATAASTGRVYPVPATDEVTVECSPCACRQALLSVMDATGRTVRTLHLPVNTSVPTLKVDLRGLAAGVHHLRLICGTEVRSYPVVLH
ncbi:MAG: hypothetical protein R2817_04025 [Flavobacteriales bacterium]